LVQDDQEDLRQVQEMLAAWEQPFSLTTVASLAEALTALEDRRFDVVLLDLSLPDASGLTPVTHLHDAAPGVPIVVLSSANEEPLAVQAVKVGAQDYLVKGRNEGNQLTRSIQYSIQRKRSEEDLIYLAHYDHLTGLLNRTIFTDRLGHALTRATREDDVLALMFVDVDGFKVVNDTYGHHVGDLLLKSAAQRMRGCLRKVDTLARLSGDEFTVIAEDIKEATFAPHVAQKVLDCISQPFTLEGNEVSVTASVGVVVFPFDGRDPETLIRAADEAMYRAKDAGGNAFRFHNEDLIATARPPGT